MENRLPPARAITLPRILIVTLAVLVPLMAPGARGAQAGEPTEQLRRHVDRVLEVLRDPGLARENRAEERRAAIRKAASEVFDFEETARRALGRHWRDRTPAERTEFVRLFTDLLEHTYLSRIEQYQGEKIVYTGESIEGDRASVQTRLVTPKASEIPVEYRMRREGDRWRVYDVAIEGVSLVANYRAQFERIVQTESYAALVERLRTRALPGPGQGQGDGRRG